MKRMDEAFNEITKLLGELNLKYLQIIQDNLLEIERLKIEIEYLKRDK